VRLWQGRSALQDAGRVPLLGSTTYGKGSVQLPHNLSNGGIMRITIARWYTPEDRTIDGTGLTPDMVVSVSEEELDAGADPQLDAALDYLLPPTSMPVSAPTSATTPTVSAPVGIEMN
jgi:carboxyl-terminal processing protease